MCGIGTLQDVERRRNPSDFPLRNGEVRCRVTAIMRVVPLAVASAVTRLSPWRSTPGW